MKLSRVAAAAVLICSLMFGPAVVKSQAADLTIIVDLYDGSSLALVSSLLNASVLDSIPGTRTYLLRVNAFPTLSNLLRALSGIRLLEPNVNLRIPSYLQYGVLQTADGTSADWYHAQPAMQLIRAGEAHQVADGRGIVVADIDSIVDYSHPALRTRLTGGHDFVLQR